MIKSKLTKVLAGCLIASSLFMGCGNKTNNETTNDTTKNETQQNNPDVITSASKANDEATLEKALSKDGSWIILLQNDIKTTKDLVLEGDFTKPDKDNSENMVPAGRNITLYNKDDSGNISETYTLSAPKLTIKSKDTIMKDGTFDGDIYVEASNFTLYKTKVNGNVYFMNEDAKNSFKLEEGATVTGKTEMK